MPALRLVAINGGKHYPLDKDLVLIGRQELSDIHIDHKSVSKQHCILMAKGTKLWLRDLGSTNGCHVNGKRVRRSMLNLNDILGVAGFNFRVASAETGKKKQQRDEPGTAKLNQEDLRRLEQGLAQSNSHVGQGGPVVQVNKLPDEYTQVDEEHEAS